MDRGQAGPFSGAVESSQLMVAQREVPVVPFHIGAGALEHLGTLRCFGLEPVVLHRARLPQRPTRRNQPCAEGFGTRTKWLPLCHRPGCGHAIEGIRWHQRRRHGGGRGLRHTSLAHLPLPILRDELDGGLHCGDHALGFLDPIHAGLAEVFWLGNGTDRVKVALDITGNARAVSPYPALEVDKVVGVADGAEVLGDLLALSPEALVLLASGFHVLLGLLAACGHLRGTTRATRSRLAVGGVAMLADPLECLLGLGGGLSGRPLLDSQRGRHRLAECMLHRDEVR